MFYAPDRCPWLRIFAGQRKNRKHPLQFILPAVAMTTAWSLLDRLVNSLLAEVASCTIDQYVSNSIWNRPHGNKIGVFPNKPPWQIENNCPDIFHCLYFLIIHWHSEGKEGWLGREGSGKFFWLTDFILVDLLNFSNKNSFTYRKVFFV